MIYLQVVREQSHGHGHGGHGGYAQAPQQHVKIVKVTNKMLFSNARNANIFPLYNFRSSKNKAMLLHNHLDGPHHNQLDGINSLKPLNK